MRRIEHTLNTNSNRESKSKYNRNKILGTIEKTLGLWAVSLFPSLYHHLRAVNIMKIWDRRYNDTQYHRFGDVILYVPLVAREMRKAGFTINEIEKVNFYDAYDFYNRRLNLH